MKNRLLLIPLLLTGSCAVALGSWVANLYGVGEVQSLLSAEGLRHEVRSALHQYMACPELGIFLVVAPGLGLAWGSGWLDALSRWARRRPLTRRERRSLDWAFTVLALSLALLALAIWSPWGCLMGVTGRLYPSPALEGAPLLLGAVLALTGWIYGYASGRFRHYGDVRQAFALPLRRCAYYPVALFFVVRLFGQLAYTRLPMAAGLDAESMVAAFHAAAIALFIYVAATSK
jgi:aminobenzoyl-glutamate transport protein